MFKKTIHSKDVNLSTENICQGTMVFSQNERYPSSTANIPAKKSFSKYDMIQYAQNTKPCNKCRGVK